MLGGNRTSSLRKAARGRTPLLTRFASSKAPIYGYYPTATAESRTEFTPSQLSNRSLNAALLRCIESYRTHGHRAATIDPLGMMERPSVPALDPRRYGFTLDESFIRPQFRSSVLPDRRIAGSETFNTDGLMLFPEADNDAGERDIEDITTHLGNVYAGNIGFEMMHITSSSERAFLTTLLETTYGTRVDDSRSHRFWELLMKSEAFDRFAAKKFPNVKRYGLEGGESMMVVLDVLIERAKSRQIRDIVLAMPHRGRLNVLTQLMDLDMRILVRKMKGLPTLPASLSPAQFSDDVLSHLWTSTAFDDTTLHLLPNPSHLEAVSGVALGVARGIGMNSSSSTSFSEKVLSVQIHGDAAFGGQGVTAEALNLASLPHFNVGGTIHIVVNNQLGFTTGKLHGRTSFYATDLAKSIACPILHVNGDAVNDVARSVEIAMAYQAEFRKDVVIDLVVYRRKGHNEMDSPDFTSPLLYSTISKHASVLQIYQSQLLERDLLTREEIGSTRAEIAERLESSILDSSSFVVPEIKADRGWEKMIWPKSGQWQTESIETGVDVELLREAGRRSVEVPEYIVIHPRLLKMHVSKRLESIKTGNGIDFSTAEAMAIGSLLDEGISVRLCGQDSGRGTFSQRHAVLCDQSSTDIAVPLQSITSSPLFSSSGSSSSKAGTFEIVNSPLSEYAVLGFEQGVSWTSPNLLPIWEAQFGDFANTCQVIIDTFFVSSESKWGLQSAMTLLLPHGFDSAGPEHSSSRVERFLQMSNEPLGRDDHFVPNMHIVNITTPSNYFHVLRRQMKRQYRKPLVVLTPKGILRLPAASSSIEEVAPGTSFQSVIDDSSITNRDQVERVVFLSGKMYYDLVKARSELGLEGRIAFIRIEEVSPFPYSNLSTIIAQFSSAKSFVWAQEAPQNAEAYTFVSPRLSQLLPSGHSLRYIGRKVSASVAEGVAMYFNASKKEYMDELFDI